MGREEPTDSLEAPSETIFGEPWGLRHRLAATDHDEKRPRLAGATGPDHMAHGYTGGDSIRPSALARAEPWHRPSTACIGSGRGSNTIHTATCALTDDTYVIGDRDHRSELVHACSVVHDP